MGRFRLLIAMLAVCLQSYGNDVRIDGIYYKLNTKDNTAWAYDSSIGYYVYKQAITIPATINSDGVEYTVTGIHNKAFYSRRFLEEINLPNTIEVIGDSAFYFCTSCKIPKLPNSLKEIGKYAFYNCQELDISEIPESVQSIGEGAFKYCKGLKTLKIPDNLTVLSDYLFEDSGIEKVILPNTVEIIGVGAFLRSGLQSINSPASVKKIDSGAFNDCKMEEVHIPSIEAWLAIEHIGHALRWGASLYINGERVTELVIPETITSVGKSAFWGNDFTSIRLPNTLTTISRNAFAESRLLTEIEIPSSVTSFDVSVFYNSKKLEKVVLPDGFQNLGTYTFMDCENLKSINIPESIEILKECVFWNCGFTSFTIPKHVKKIERWALADCPKLTELIIDSEDLQIADSVFMRYRGESYNPLTCVKNLSKTPHKISDKVFRDYKSVLLVPKGCVPAYQAAEGWKNFAYITDDEEECKRLVDKITTGISDLHVQPAAPPAYDLQGHQIREGGRQTICIVNGKKVLR